MSYKKISIYLNKIVKILPYKNDLPIVAILLLIIFLFLVPASFEKDLCCDFMGQPVPWYHFLNLSLKQGIIPLWSPYSFLGLPFLFTPTLSFFHPLTLLIVVLNLFLNFDQPSIEVTGKIIQFVIIFSVFLGGLGIYALCRRIFNLSRFTALFAGIVFSLNPYRLYDTQSLFVDWAVSSLPWIFLVLALFLSKPKFKLYVLLSLGNILIFAAGYPYFYVYFIAAEILLAVFYGAKKTALFFLALVNSILLSGFFLLPYLHVMFTAGRVKDDYSFFFHSFASYFPTAILQIVNPLAFSVNLNYPNISDIFPGPTVTWGTFAFIFLIYGFFTLKDKPIYRWTVVIFFISIFYSFGANLSTHSFFGTLLPVIYKFRTHSRMLLITLFAGSLLVGIGMEAIGKRIKVKYVIMAFWFICISLFIGLTLGPLFFWSKITAYSEIFKGTTIMFLFLFTSLIITTLTLKYGKKTFLILGLVILLIEYHHYYVNIKGFFMEGNETYARFYHLNPTIIEQPSNNNLFRIYFENSFTYNSAIIGQYGLQGYESNVPNAYGNLKSIYDWSPRLWQVANVKYIIAAQKDFDANRPQLIKVKTVNPADYPDQFPASEYTTPYYIYELKGYLPRFYIPKEVAPCVDEKCWMKEDSPKLVLAKGLSSGISNPTKDVKITINKYNSNTIEMEIITPNTTFVASSETYDKGWSLTVNNKPSRIYYISNGLRGFIVSGGKSMVKMNYIPAYFIEGIALFIIGVFLLFIVHRADQRYKFF